MQLTPNVRKFLGLEEFDAQQADPSTFGAPEPPAQPQSSDWDAAQRPSTPSDWSAPVQPQSGYTVNGVSPGGSGTPDAVSTTLPPVAQPAPYHQSSYNDPTDQGTIGHPLPAAESPSYTLQDGRTAPASPGGNWEPVTNLTQPQRAPVADPGQWLAEDSQSTPPQTTAQRVQETRIPAPDVRHGPEVPPVDPYRPRGMPDEPMPDRPSLDPIAALEGYGEPGRKLAAELRRAYREPGQGINPWTVYEALTAIPFEVVSRARRELIPDKEAVRASGTDPVAPFRQAAADIGLPLPSPEELNPEGRPASDIGITAGLTAVAPDPFDPAANAALRGAGRALGAGARATGAAGRAIGQAAEVAGRAIPTPALDTVNRDVGSSLGTGVYGAAGGAAMPAETDEERGRNALTGAAIGMAAGPVIRRGVRAPAGSARIVPPGVADTLDFPVRVPTDPAHVRAIEAAGGSVDPERGVTMNVIRNQGPEAHGNAAARGSVFYVAGKPGAQNPYATSVNDANRVGGTERIEGMTRFRSPLIISDAPASSEGFGQALRQMGVGPSDAELNAARIEFADLLDEVRELDRGARPEVTPRQYRQAQEAAEAAEHRLEELQSWSAGGIDSAVREARRRGPAGSPARAEALKEVVRRFGGTPEEIDELLRIRGDEQDESMWAIRENILAAHARRNGYDGVVTVQSQAADHYAVANHPEMKAAQNAADLAEGRLADVGTGIYDKNPAKTPEQQRALQEFWTARENVDATRKRLEVELSESNITELADVREARNPTPGAPNPRIAEARQVYDDAMQRYRDAAKAVDWENEQPGQRAAVEALGDEGQRAHDAWRAIEKEGPSHVGEPGYTLRDDVPRRQSTSALATPGVGASAGLVGDLGNSVGGGVAGAAAGGAMPADSEEQRRQNMLTGAAIGMVGGPAAGRLMPRTGGALATFGVSPSYKPPTAAQVQAAERAGARRGAQLNRTVKAPPSDVPPGVRASVAGTDDRAGMRWAEDVLSEAAGSPRMRENDPRRPSTQSRVNTGSIANERIQNDLEPAITNAGRAGLHDELPQFVEDTHQKDILDEFYSRGHKESMDASQPRIDAAKAKGASAATIQRMEAIAQQRADAAGVKKMRQREGGSKDMTYEAIQARLQTQEARLTKDGRWDQLQESAQAIWDHNDATRQRLFDAGEVDQEWLDYMRQAYPHYVPTVPISHLDSRTGGAVASSGGPRVSRGNQKAVSALDDVGTSGERLNPIVATRNATVRAERTIQRNNVATAFAQMMDDALQASPGTMGTGSSHRTFMGGGVDVTYMANGKPVTMSVPKVVADGLEAAANMSADPGTVGRLWKAAMGFVTSAMTAGRASFLPVNLLRDVQDYALRTAANEGGPAALPGVMGTWMKQAGHAAADIALAQANVRGGTGAALGAITGAAAGDEDTTVAERIRHAAGGAVAGTFLVGANKVKSTGSSREFLARGGGSGGLSAHYGAGQRWYREVMRDGGAVVKSPADAARYVGDWLQDIATLQGVKGINERTELISRTAAMQRGDAQKLAPTEAMIRGRDASIDFDRAGTVARVINGIVPFFNATVQGGAQTARLFKQNPVAAAATITATLAPVMLAAEAWNRSDPTRAEVYNDIPQYVKDTGLVAVLPWAGSDNRGDRPNYLWIPTGATTPFVVGLRRAMADVPGLEPAAASTDGWLDTLGTVIQTFSPLRGDSFGAAASNLVPQGIKQGLELAGNQDFYRGNPIATDNADERASAFSRGAAGLANATGRATGSDFLQNVRPSQAEHLVNALPAYGDIIKGASDMVAPSGFKQAEDRPIQNEPFVGGVAQRIIRDTGGANLTRAQESAFSEGVRSVVEDAGMRPADVSLSVSGRWKNGPLTRDEQVAWQQEMNDEADRAFSRIQSNPKWRRPETQEQAVTETLAAARETAARRARLPSEAEMQRRIRDEQSMKAAR